MNINHTYYSQHRNAGSDNDSFEAVRGRGRGRVRVRGRGRGRGIDRSGRDTLDEEQQMEGQTQTELQQQQQSEEEPSGLDDAAPAVAHASSRQTNLSKRVNDFSMAPESASSPLPIGSFPARIPQAPARHGSPAISVAGKRRARSSDATAKVGAGTSAKRLCLDLDPKNAPARNKLEVMKPERYWDPEVLEPWCASWIHV
eukprot:SAG31_NODE_4748_length_2982_cov_1.601110_4_plen_200_part_00